MKIPFFDLKRQDRFLKPELTIALKSLFKSGNFILESQVETFEKRFASFIGVKYGIGVNSGTDALKISLRALEIGRGDEVITVPNTAVPTVSAIREAGATPTFVDVKDDYLLNENQLNKAFSKKIKAIIPVHLYGQACQMKAILRFAQKHDLKVIEDCAQAHGARFNDKKVGSFGDLSCFSFYPTKNLGAYGDGGMILSRNHKLAEKCRRLRMYGMKKIYKADLEGYNSRLDEIQAAILNIKLKYLARWNRKRRQIADYYLNNIHHKLISLPLVNEGNHHVFHLFVIRCRQRSRLLSYLQKKGIEFKIHYPYPVHLQKAYQFLGYKKGDFPVAERLAEEVISLPLFPEISKKELEYTVKALNSF